MTQRRRGRRKHVGRPKYLPSRTVIAAACEQIRRRWTAKQEIDRRLWAYVPPVEVEVVSFGPLG